MANKVLIIKGTGKAIEGLNSRYMNILVSGDPSRYEIAEESPKTSTEKKVVADPVEKKTGEAVKAKKATTKRGRRPSSKA